MLTIFTNEHTTKILCTFLSQIKIRNAVKVEFRIFPKLQIKFTQKTSFDFSTLHCTNELNLSQNWSLWNTKMMHNLHNRMHTKLKWNWFAFVTFENGIVFVCDVWKTIQTTQTKISLCGSEFALLSALFASFWWAFLAHTEETLVKMIGNDASLVGKWPKTHNQFVFCFATVQVQFVLLILTLIVVLSCFFKTDSFDSSIVWIQSTMQKNWKFPCAIVLWKIFCCGKFFCKHWCAFSAFWDSFILNAVSELIQVSFLFHFHLLFWWSQTVVQRKTPNCLCSLKEMFSSACP